MSGISGGRGRHAASHAKPGKLTVTKTKVTTTAAVTGAIAFAGGVAEAVHVRSGQLRQQQAQADAVPTTALSRGLATANDQIISQLLQQRGAAAGAVNRDLNRGLSNVVGGPAATTAATTPPLTIATSPTPTSLAPLTTPGSAAVLAGVTPSSGVPTTLPPTSEPGSTDSPTATPTPTPTPSSAPAPTATTAKPTAKPTTAVSHPAGWDATPAQARALAQSMVPASQWACFDNIITRESSWNVHAVNPSSGAYGLPQALPGDKMASVSSDWRDDAVTQIKWAIDYMDGRYGSPCAAWSFWQAHNWY